MSRDRNGARPPAGSVCRRRSRRSPRRGDPWRARERAVRRSGREERAGWRPPARTWPGDLDIRDRQAMYALVDATRPALLVHCAAQPSHELARDRPFEDFDVNAVGTLNLLEAVRRFCPETSFIFMSTNKVYGDAPNERPLVEKGTRWDYADPMDAEGINEECRIDATLHSLFGASKLAADVMVQEY